MESFRLKHAPIEEAIIGLYVEYDLNLVNSSLKKLRDSFERSFSQDDPLNINQASFEISEEGATVGDTRTLKGRIFKNKDDTQFLVLDGTTIRYHQLKPYSYWEMFTQEFFEFLDVLRPILILEGEATPFIRFINKLEAESISRLQCSFKQDFLLLDRDNETVIEKAFHATELRSEKYRSTGRVLVNVQKNNSDEIEFIMFDIDLKSNAPVHEVKQAALNAHFSSLRDFKNDVFFSNVKNAEEVYG